MFMLQRPLHFLRVALHDFIVTVILDGSTVPGVGRTDSCEFRLGLDISSGLARGSFGSA